MGPKKSSKGSKKAPSKNPSSPSTNIYDLLDQLNSNLENDKEKIDILEKNINEYKSQIEITEINTKLDQIEKYRNQSDKKAFTLNDLEIKSNVNSENSLSIEDIKSEFNSAFQNLTNSVKTIKDTINLVDLLISNNKLETLFKIKNKKIQSIYDNVINIDINKPDFFENTINNLNKYFKNEINNDFINEVYKDVKIDQSTNIIDDTKSFFDSYKKYYENLIKSINDLLDKINNNDLVLINKYSDYINNYTASINKKMIKYKSIINDTDDKLKNTKKGKTTYILPYSDVLYASIIQLVIIVDFLSYFYRPK